MWFSACPGSRLNPASKRALGISTEIYAATLTTAVKKRFWRLLFSDFNPCAPIGPQYILPDPCLITESAKTAGLISISSQGLCGEEDFGCVGQKKAKIPAGMAGSLQAKKDEYPVNMRSFQSCDRFLSSYQRSNPWGDQEAVYRELLAANTYNRLGSRLLGPLNLTTYS
jgi:hypothetical protein